MVHSLAPAEPTVTRFETTVEEVRDDGTCLILESTYFYPEGGGQPADRGQLDGIDVTHVETIDDHVHHHLATSAAVSIGDRITGQIDPAFRRYCRRAHTASHVVFGAGRRLFDDIGYGGFDIDEKRVRVDLRVPEGFGDDSLVELERLANRCVWDSRTVTWNTVPREEAFNRPEVAFNEATEEGVQADEDSIRLVTVADWDIAACGGTHVTSTAEIGPITVQDRSNPGEGLTRVEFSVGPTAIDRRATEITALRRAATTLGVPLTDIDDGVTDLTDRLEAVTAERDDLKQKVVDTTIDTFDTFDKKGQDWRLGTISDVDANTVSEVVRNPGVDVVGVAGTDGSTFLVVASGDETSISATAIIDAVTDQFGGGGGGQVTIAQAGGLEGQPDQVIEFLRDRDPTRF